MLALLYTLAGRSEREETMKYVYVLLKKSLSTTHSGGA